MPAELSESTPNGRTDLYTLLVVEDDESIGDLLVQTIKSETPYAVLLVADAVQALKAVEAFKPSLFILDYHLPGIDGLELHDRLHSIQGLEAVPSLMMSSHSPSRQAIRQRQITFLKKPFDLADLLDSIERLLAQEHKDT